MAGVSLPDMRPWGRRQLTIPPNSAQAWLRLAVWEIWMGALACILVSAGIALIASSPDRVIKVSDFSNCYGLPPIPDPCERIVYRGGAMNVMFAALCGVFLIGVACWLLWELWSAAEPKPITDDFLRLLHDSFGRSWLNPLKWPWPRLFWAYGFSLIGAILTAGAVMTIAALATPPAQAPTVQIDTSQSFRLGQ